MRKLLFSGAALLLSLAGSAQAADKVDFDKQIRPIFAASCYKCHAGSKHKGDLKLDSLEAIKKGGKDAKDKIIVAGDPGKSDLIRRVALPKDDDDVMPPDGKGEHLKPDQVELVKAWIAEGASFGDWKEDKLPATSDDKSPGDKSAAGDAEAPKEIPLPQVAAADAGALDKLRQAGAQVLPLAQGTNLLSVEFTSNAAQINDSQVEMLGSVAAQIYDLNLANTKVTDDALKALEGMKNLHRLHLERTAITDGGLAHLKGLTSLEYLNLYNTGVTDAGLAQLEGLKGLKNLYLWQSKVTDTGAEGLKKSLPTLSIDTGWKEPAKQ
ncbi:MAG: ribonuclease inhibitor [Phycisphaerales bacterium]|nr:ribonuclease inhibitor [Phycisphaerales bacterium]